MAIQSSNLTLMVKDIDRSVAFYQSIGFTLANRWGNHYAQITAPGITIGLHPAGDGSPSNSGNASIGFVADDFEAANTLLRQHSIEVEERSEEGGKFLHFTDPDGTALYFIQPKW
ncbi:MAG: VOC family protein [Lewinellaceae bacterium]|nr:VOC family protein [Saprospiraceae bacterium]MCB9338133.1 VOC family protein [Lewinellaceae bacterium]